jgi:hypothetical protein
MIFKRLASGFRARGTPDRLVVDWPPWRLLPGFSSCMTRRRAQLSPVATVRGRVAFTRRVRAYDQDEEHNRARAGLLPMTEQIARVQFEMP